MGGGVVTGRVDEEGSVTGDKVVYAYPDFKTLLVGQFYRSKMVSAKLSQLIGVKFDPITSIPSLLYNQSFMEQSKEVYTYTEGDVKSPGVLLQPDPFESQHVYVKESTVPHAGLGLFAKKPGTFWRFNTYLPSKRKINKKN